MGTEGGITVRRQHNVIEIYRMNHPKVVSDFIKSIRFGLRYGHQDFRVRFRNTKSAYPDVCTPIAGIIDFYRKQGFEFVLEFTGKEDYVSRAHIDSPLIVSENTNQLLR